MIIQLNHFKLMNSPNAEKEDITSNTLNLEKGKDKIQ